MTKNSFTPCDIDNDTMKIQNIYNKYSLKYYNCRSSEIFFSFTLDDCFHLNSLVYGKGYCGCYFDGRSVFLKKQDILQSASLDKIEVYLREYLNPKFNYTEVNRFLYLGHERFYKPDVVVYTEYNEDTFNDFMDLHCTNPPPSFIFELVDIKNRQYLLNLIFTYENCDKLYENIQIFFIDILNKVIFKLKLSEKFRKNGNTEMSQIVNTSDEYDEVYSRLIRLNYHGNLIIKGLKINFEEILTNKNMMKGKKK